MKLTFKTRKTGIPTQQAREKGAPLTDTSVYNTWNFLFKLDKLGFQPSKQGRQELPGLILQSVIVKTYYEIYGNWDSNPASKGERSSLD